jgi:methyl-accepting chemotaxis protein
MTEEAQDQLAELTARLERTAARLRSDELSAQQAAELVDHCARLADDAGRELDRLAGARVGATPGQGELL